MRIPLDKKIAVLLIIAAYLISACSGSSSYGTLSFFFDGVPNPNKPKVDTIKIMIDSTGIKKREEILKKANPNYVLHGPYGAKLCENCHNVDQGFSLLRKEPDLCYKCHDNFAKKAKFLHAPVAAGYCTKCHNPHRSKNKFLLLEIGQKLCFTCHNKADVKRDKKHPVLKNENCLKCHNPHGSNNQYFLRP